MGTAELQAAMQAAGVNITSLQLRTDGESQVIAVTGLDRTGLAFTHATAPFQGDPMKRALELADLLAGRRLPDPPAVDKRKVMSLAEKMATLAARSQAIPKALEARADALMPRLDALEKLGTASFAGLETVIADAEKGVAAAEAAMRQLTNGGPSSGSGS